MATRDEETRRRTAEWTAQKKAEGGVQLLAWLDHEYVGIIDQVKISRKLPSRGEALKAIIDEWRDLRRRDAAS